MYADVRDMVLRKEPFVTTCCTQYNLNDIAGKAYQVSLQKGGDVPLLFMQKNQIMVILKSVAVLLS